MYLSLLVHQMQIQVFDTRNQNLVYHEIFLFNRKSVAGSNNKTRDLCCNIYR